MDQDNNDQTKIDEMIAADIDALIDAPLSDSDVDTALVGEISNILTDATMVNDFLITQVEDANITMKDLNSAEAALADVEKMQQLKEDI